MTTIEVARLLHARKTGKGRFMARCPAHRERTASLSISDMGHGRTRLHCFASCTQRQVIEAAGLKWRDLRPGDVTPEIKRMMSLEDSKESLERQSGLVHWLGTLDKNKRRYWAAAERRIQGELNHVRCALEPEKVYQEWRERNFQQRVKKYGMEKLWESVHEN